MSSGKRLRIVFAAALCSAATPCCQQHLTGWRLKEETIELARRFDAASISAMVGLAQECEARAVYGAQPAVGGWLPPVNQAVVADLAQSDWALELSRQLIAIRKQTNHGHDSFAVFAAPVPEVGQYYAARLLAFESQQQSMSPLCSLRLLADAPELEQALQGTPALSGEERDAYGFTRSVALPLRDDGEFALLRIHALYR